MEFSLLRSGRHLNRCGGRDFRHVGQKGGAVSALCADAQAAGGRPLLAVKNGFSKVIF